MNKITENLTKMNLYGLRCRLHNANVDVDTANKVIQAAHALIEVGPPLGGMHHGPWYLKTAFAIGVCVPRPFPEPNDSISLWKTQAKTYVVKPAEEGRGELVASVWRIDYYRTLRGDREYVGSGLDFDLSWRPIYKNQFVCSDCGLDANPERIYTPERCVCGSSGIV